MRILLFNSLIFLILFQYSLYAGNREFSRLTLEDGLSQSTVFDVMQDRKGYLWVTTQDGLNRYDGYSFKVFRHSILDSQSISDNSLGRILFDLNGDIWVSTIHGNINQYHREENIFSSYQLGELNGVQEDANFFSMVRDSSGFIWFGIKGAIGKLNSITKKITIYRTYFPGKVISLPYVFVDKKNNVWAGDKYGLYLYNVKEDQFELFHFKNNVAEFVKNIVAITEDNSGKLWLAVRDHAPFRLDIKKRKIVVYEQYFSASDLAAFGKLTSILYTSTEEVVLGTENDGLYIFNPKSGRVEHLTNNPLDNKSISFNYVLSLCEDRAQNLWVGTLNGLNKLDLKVKKFETFRFGAINNSDRIPLSIVLSVYRDSKKNIWLGTYSAGLYTIDGKKDKVSKFDLLPYKGTEIWAVREISDGVYLLGTDMGLNLIDIKKDEAQYFAYESGGENTGYMVRDIVPYGKNKFWIGSLEKGILLFDVDKNKLLPLDLTENGKKSELDVLSIFTDHAGILWIGTRLSGLYYYNPSTGLLSSFRYDDKRLNSEFKRINSIVEDKENKIWVAAENGLICIKEDRKNTVHYTTKDGLLNSFIYAVEIDKQNNIWVSTNSGLSKIHFNKYGASLIYNYTMRDGLQANEFDTNCSFLDDEGKLYFGGIGGLNIFDPQKIYKNPHVPVVAVNRVIVNKKVITPTDGRMKVVLKPYYSNLEFNFSALDFTNTENNQYAYKLDGFDPDWVYSGVRNSVRYTGLTPGDYVFYVKGSNNDGVWSENIESVNVVVLTPLWETLWARLLYIFVLILLVVLLIVLRTKKVIKDKIVLNKKVKQITGELQANYRKLEKTKTELINSVKRKAVEVLADGMAHDFNNLLFVILNSAQLLKDGVDTPEKRKLVENIEISAVDAAAIIKRVQDFSTKNDRAANDVVDISSVLLNAIDLIKPKMDDIEKKNNIVIKIKKNIDIDWIFYGSLSEFRLALTNILINAIESFEKSGTIMVSSHFDGKNKGIIEISDEGKGMDKETVNNIFDPFFTTKGVQNSGLGLSQAYGIVTRNNGTIVVESRPGDGTKIVINLPAQLKNNSPDEKDSEKQVRQNDFTMNRKSILVVEDEAIIRELYGEILSMQGYHFEMAETGEEGVQMWESGQYNLVICDLGLPGLLSGWDVIEKIREKDREMPVLVVTGWGNSIERTKIEKYQVNRVLSKPVAVNKLVSEIAAMIN